MTKPFRVHESVAKLTQALRSPSLWPENFYDLLRERDIDPLCSALVVDTPDQGCLCIAIVDQHRRLIEFDLEYDGALWCPKPETTARISYFTASDLDADDLWWRDHPRMTAPKPSNHIFVALQLLGEDWKPKGRKITRC
ncbi:MAG: hypothetical protein ACPGVO_02845 [Spirulinaceae cyanobacterium]